MRTVSNPNLLDGRGNLATKLLTKLQKNSLKVFAFVLSSKHIMSSFLRHMFEIVHFLEVKPKDFRAFHNSLFNCSSKNHKISTYPFLFIIRRFECYYTHCQETALN